MKSQVGTKTTNCSIGAIFYFRFLEKVVSGWFFYFYGTMVFIRSFLLLLTLISVLFAVMGNDTIVYYMTHSSFRILLRVFVVSTYYYGSSAIFTGFCNLYLSIARFGVLLIWMRTRMWHAKYIM